MKSTKFTVKFKTEVIFRNKRCLRNVMSRDLSVTVFNQTFQMPIGLSPTARQKRWTSDGEVATVKGKFRTHT